jgi:hypothetical protein
VAQIPVGQTFHGFLILVDTVQFTVTPTEEGFTVIHDKVHDAYNSFIKTSSVLASSDTTESGIALVTWPGFITGYGLCQQLVRNNYYGASTVIITSASSKVSLATAFFLKQHDDSIHIIGYTSDANKDFCSQTGLYDSILEYTDNDALERVHSCVLIDVAGNESVYQDVQSKLVKALAVGNTHDVPDESSTSKHFSAIGTMKLIMTFMGISNWIRKWLTPQLELFLVMDIMQELKQELGQEELDERLDAAMKLFVDTIIDKNWTSIRTCDTLDSIQQAHVDICRGTVKPSEAVVLDMITAVKKCNYTL